MGSQRISDDALLADLERVAEEVDRPPSKIDYDDHGKFSYRTLEIRFGSTGDNSRWQGVLLTADMEPRSTGRPAE